MRFWNEDGSPFALKGVDNKARLDALEARIAALEAGAEPEDAPSKK
jgi:BMFP domain-containing protein YqiC